MAALQLQKKFPSFNEFVKPAAAVKATRRTQSAQEQIDTFRGVLDRRKRTKGS